MPRLIAALVRHGIYDQPEDVPSAHLAHPLLPEGEVQARRAATELLDAVAREGWTLHEQIDSSTLLRAWQTASVIADTLRSAGGRFDVCEFEALAERSLGSATNLTIAQIEDVLRLDPRVGPPPADWKSDSWFRLPLPGAESLMASGERVARHLNQRMDELGVGLGSDTIKIFVGHGGSIRHAAVHLKLIEEHKVRGLSVHHCRPLIWERADDGSWRHLSGDWKELTAP